jgi:Flp pilus assembly protein TadG
VAGTRGQATVELALALPIVAVVAVGLVQVGVSIRNELAVELAAREGARAAAVAADPAGAADAAAHRAVDLRLHVATSTDAEVVAVTVEHTDRVAIPLLGSFLGPVTHTATASMALEPP